MRSTFSMADEYITMTRGDTVSFAIEITDEEEQGIDMDTIFLSCKASLLDSSYVFQKSIGDGIERSETGKYTVRIAPEDTYNLVAGKYFYDLQLGVYDDIFTIKKGILEIDADVTREE